jgi:hypothetical protein
MSCFLGGFPEDLDDKEEGEKAGLTQMETAGCP